MNASESALVWITDIIKKHHIPYQIAGGLAVRAYGSTRPLMDIDIDIPEDDFDKILEDVREHITFGPDWFKSDTWQLYLMTLNYQGQEIDICGAYRTKIYNKLCGTWDKIITDFSKVTYIEFEGLKLPVIPRDELIAYKKILARPVDWLDLAYLEQS